MILQPNDGIAERPGIGLRLRTVSRWIVGRRMGTDPIGDVLNDRRAEIAPGPFGRPFRDRIDGEIVVAVDPERGNAETQSAGSEGPCPASRDALERGDRPLIVDDVENYRSLVGGRED